MRLTRPSAGLVLLMTGVFACKTQPTTQPPPTPVPTTVEVSPSSATLTALGATQQLTAAVKDQNGQTMSGASVTWNVVTASVASVSTVGLVTALANGTTQVTATAGSVSGSASITVAQASAAMAKTGGDAQTGQVGTALPTPIEVEIRDSRGNPMPGGAPNTTVTFAVTQGGGMVANGTVVAGPNGRASTTWTLGTSAGMQEVTASIGGGPPTAVFTATANPGPATAMTKFSGDGQTGPHSTALPESLVVRVADTFDNPVSGYTVTFAATSGGGSVSPTSAQTGANGRVATRWTLGSTVGGQTAEAQASTAIMGSTATFNATATTLVVSQVAPDTVVEGATATITGDGFDPTPGNNTVMIGGVAATVTMASTMSLTVTVPTFDCQPARNVNVRVSVGGANSNTVSHPLKPSNVLSLAVGQQQVIRNPADFCVQLAASTTGADAYLIGVGAAAETPTSLMAFSISSGVGASPAPAAPRPQAQPRWVGGTPFESVVEAEVRLRRDAQWRGEQALRNWERQHVPALMRTGRPTALGAAPRLAGEAKAPPNVGDTVRFRVPNNFSDPCNAFVTITTVVQVVGTAGVWVRDIANPTQDSLKLADVQAYSDTFDLHIYARDTLYFGTPSDIDNTQRVFVVLTVEVNKITNPPGVAGFVFGGDLFPRASCASSDTGEIFYSHVPDPNNVAGTGARSKAGVLFQMPSLIAHEFTHNIQQSRRIMLGGNFMQSWEAEGQATLAEEVVGHSVLGNVLGQNYTSAVARTGQGARWYGAAFEQLGRYFGRISPGGGKAANAPEQCTLFGNTMLTSPCNVFAFYGASWSFQRYVSDRFGPSYTGGETRLHRDVISKNPSLTGKANWASVLNMDVDTVFARWAGMLYSDDRILGAMAPLTMTSWNLFEIMNSFGSMDYLLVPTERTFSAFADSRSVRGGSTAYTRISATAGPRPALAVKIRDTGGGVLGTTLAPQVWVVRQQ